ncbi:Coenzyme F420 hydrogenase/dehydrogenase, beta subunit C-terminal domain [Desulfogranum marinum]|uniref:Coenzyme F420 hydrogenase/dehydrogenase, beta subunit C-terminal domain n=1 Tax=Desulfogranum marinum TaxID=453220 RepID=UPI0029C83C09|nr:Coenzyme F420 hydrogenase/dehydrogenase, beta subunit C-terminal domain [Desulfogranum marinum]
MNKNKYQYYLGYTKRIFCGYSNNQEIIKNCASGGIVSTVFMWLLDNNIVDGCLVYDLSCEGGKFSVIHKIITSSEELATYGGSIYIDFPAISRPILDDIRNFNGKIAIVGLPCSITVLKKIISKDEKLREKIAFTLGLFCGHTSKRSLIETVLTKKNINIDDIEDLAFRKGLWRGKTTILLKNGNKIKFPSSHFTTYQNLFIDSAHKCINCSDHYAENADLSTGDIWKKEYKRKDRKHSVFTTRSALADKIIGQIINDGQLNVFEADQKLLFQANKRAVIWHKATRAKSLVGALLGYKIKSNETAPAPRWNEIVAALVVLPIMRLSESKYRNILFIVPRKILYSILIGFKLLTNF